MPTNSKKIICLMGPTASGKTKLAIELTSKLSCSIISVDSGMVYRGLDIGTAKPTKEELAVAPHRLIDIVDPAEPYSVGRFREDALCEIVKIFQEGKTPLLVGGTMLYFHVLRHGLSVLPKADPIVRAKLAEEAVKHGTAYLHERLSKIDPESAARIQQNDLQRLQRALELYELTGQIPTTLYALNKAKPLPYDIINIALNVEKTILNERIVKRFDLMLANGFVEEVEQLLRRGDLNPDLPALRSVGYRQAWQYVTGQIDFETMRETAIIATRQLAKRQMTWLRSFDEVQWIGSDEKDIQLLITNLLA